MLHLMSEAEYDSLGWVFPKSKLEDHLQYSASATISTSMQYEAKKVTLVQKRLSTERDDYH